MSKNLHVKGNYFTDAKATEGSKPSCQNHFNNRSIILSVDSTKRCFHFSYLLGKNIGTVPIKDGWFPYLLTNHEKTQLSSKTKQTRKHVCMALWSASKPPANFLHLLIWSFPHCVHPTALPCKALWHLNPYFCLLCFSEIQAGSPCSGPCPTLWWCQWC